MLLAVAAAAAALARSPSCSPVGGQHCCTNCVSGTGAVAPCGPGNQRCTANHSDAWVHIQDPSGCGINDVNAPFFDPVHKMYHIFYQLHVAQSNGGARCPAGAPRCPTGEGPVWAHAVSPDLVRWHPLPVALWNGPQPYDQKTVASGSATIVDGKPVIVYAGWGAPNAFAAAVPADASDALYTNWTKTGVLTYHTDDDPSRAWRTASGEWRLIANGGASPCNKTLLPLGCAPIWASTDFKNFTLVGATNLPVGENPSLFELPPLTPGAHVPNATLPTHGHHWGSYYQVGSWVDGTPGSGNAHAGRWVGVRGETDQPVCDRRHCGSGALPGGGTAGGSCDARCHQFDKGCAAAHDFWDAKNGRRVLFLWIRGGRGAMTLPRVVTYHPALEQLVTPPLPELASLRLAAAAKSATGSVVVRQPTPLMLGPWPAAKAVEVVTHFAIPSHAVNFSLSLCAAGGTHCATASVRCAAALRPAAGGGVRIRGVTVGLGGAGSDELRLLPTDGSIELRLFADAAAVEAYFGGGRVALSSGNIGLPQTFASAKLVVDAAPGSDGATVTLLNATAWPLASIYATRDEVLKASAIKTDPRPR